MALRKTFDQKKRVAITRNLPLTTLGLVWGCWDQAPFFGAVEVELIPADGKPAGLLCRP